MYSQFTTMYQGLGDASQDAAKQMAHGSARIADLIQLSTRVWIQLLSETAADTTKAFQELAACRSPGDLAEAQQRWFEAMNRRNMENLNKLMELSAVVVGGMEMPPAEDRPAPVAPVAVPVAKVEAAAPSPTPSPAKAEIAEPAPAPAPVPAPKPAKAAKVKAPAAEAVAAEAPAAQPEETKAEGAPARPFAEAVAAQP